jgi:hypothetical protein
MPDVAPYYVLLDSNVWVAERLLQSSIGSALLYALARTKSSILLPEVVELEIARILPDMQTTERTPPGWRLRGG